LRRGQARGLVRALAVLTLAVLVAVAAAGVLSPAAALRAVALVGVALLAAAVAAGALAGFGRVERRRRRRAQPQPGASPVLVERAERRLELAMSFALQFESLRRDLRAAAEQRLAGRGLRFESEAARELLGEEAWELLAAPAKADGFAPGLERGRLARLLAALEGV
jgi:hypothetical protein